MPLHGQQQRRAQEHGRKARVVDDQPGGTGTEGANGKEPGRDQGVGVTADVGRERGPPRQPEGPPEDVFASVAPDNSVTLKWNTPLISNGPLSVINNS